MTVDWTKPILWDGKPARVLATDMAGEYSVILRLKDARIAWAHSDGTYWSQQRVTNAPERVERWANVYAGDVCGSHGSRKAADANAESGRTALVRYVFEGDKLVSAEVVPLEDKP